MTLLRVVMKLDNNYSLLVLGGVALVVILLVWIALTTLNFPGPRRVTNTPEDAQRILNKYFGYTVSDLSDSTPVNALSSDKSSTLKTFTVLSGDSLIIKARSEEEAQAKLNADLFDDPCPCGRPQEYEEHPDESPTCDCIERGETLTWIQED